MNEAKVPMVIDADGLNSIAGTDFRGRGVQTILTPHPGEMARLTGAKVERSPDDGARRSRRSATCVWC